MIIPNLTQSFAKFIPCGLPFPIFPTKEQHLNLGEQFIFRQVKTRRFKLERDAAEYL